MGTVLKISFASLDRFVEPVTLDLDARLTSIVGPNGSGKSTLLEAAAEVLTFLHHYRFQAAASDVRKRLASQRSARPRWSSATVEIRVATDKLKTGASLAAFLAGVTGDVVTITVGKKENPDEWWAVESIEQGPVAKLELETSGGMIIDSVRKAEAERELVAVNETLQKAQERVRTLQKQRVDGNAPEAQRLEERKAEAEKARAAAQAQADDATPRLKSQIKSGSQGAVALKKGEQVDKAELEAFIVSIGSPSITYLHGWPDVGRLVAEMTALFGTRRSEPWSEHPDSEFSRLRDRLTALLKMGVTLQGHPGDKGGPVLLIDNRPVEEVSGGTWCALGFAAVSELTRGDALVIWDEPETGLHPTWATKISDLMRSPHTKPRFLIGTHRTELAPVTDPSSRVYKTVAQFAGVNNGERAACVLHSAKGLADGFAVAAHLGLEPARVLFTANAVLWVEGPSDVVYWRSWLKRAAEKRGRPLIEGFDYTFMMTGGALLSSETITGDDSALPRHIVNLLRLTGASLVIVDTDFDPMKVPLAALLADRSRLARGFVFPEAQPHLQLRVRNLIKEVPPLQGSGNLSDCYSGWGRSVENGLSDEAVCRTLIDIFGVTADAAARSFLESVRVDEWKPFFDELEEALAPALKDDQLADLWVERKGSRLLAKTDTWRNKVAFADAYAAAHPEPGLRCLRDDMQTIVNSVLDWILAVKKAYRQ